MYQVALTIWNAIAASQPLSPMTRPAFQAKDLRELEQAIDKMVEQAELAQAHPKVQRGFLTVAPLLAENESISAWMEEEDRGDLRAAIPELTSMTEALALARAEFNLSPGQERQLQEGLNLFLAKLNAESRSAPPTA